MPEQGLVGALAPSAAPLRGVHPGMGRTGRVEYGSGCATHLGSELERLGLRRVLLLSTRSLVRATEPLAGVRAAAATHLAGEFLECDAHVPETTVLRAAAVARDVGADGLVALGGSSVIDTAKAVALALADDLHEPEDFVRRRAGGARALGPAVPIAALPSTLSGGEFTAVIASTDGDRVKHLLPDERLAPVSVLLDPLLAASTPRRLWLSTGVKTLSDAIERVCSLRATPLSDALCTRAIEWFLAALPASVDGDPDGAERLRCQLASWMALFALHEQGASVGLGAALRHQVAVTFEVAHGEATCSLLPHVLRFNLALLPERAARLALAMGVEAGDDGSGVIDRIDALLEELALPRRLSELTAASADLGALASRVLAEPAAQRNPRAASVEQVQAIIEAAW